MIYQTDPYTIDIQEDFTFRRDSADNVVQYDAVFFPEHGDRPVTQYGIAVYAHGLLRKRVMIGGSAGTCLHERAVIGSATRVVICCGNAVFCLSIPGLELLWKTQADDATCFAIYPWQDSYLVHGELEISRLDRDGKVLWRQGGADIFVTPNGAEAFRLEAACIQVTDFENRVYTLDFDGNFLAR